jgi:hypothetical protein
MCVSVPALALITTRYIPLEARAVRSCPCHMPCAHLHPGCYNLRLVYRLHFLGSGTVERGCGLELDRWIQPGDVIELEVKGLGTLRNRGGDKPPRRVFTP